MPLEGQQFVFSIIQTLHNDCTHTLKICTTNNEQIWPIKKKNPCVDEKVVIRSHKLNTTDKTMAKGKGKKGQTIICKHYIEN